MKTIFLTNRRVIVLLLLFPLSLLASLVINADSTGGSGYNGCFYDGGWIVDMNGTYYVVAAIDYNAQNTTGNSSDYTGIVSITSSLSSGKQVYYIYFQIVMV